MRPLAAAVLALSLTAPLAGAALTGTVSLVQDGKPRTDASNAVVWIEGAPRTGSGPAKADMRQASKRFQPKVVAVEKNGTVEFPNDDPVYHNVFSVSGANRFDLGLYRSGASKSKEFDESGLVRVYCNIHPQMVGFVMVVDSDFFAVTGPDGKFRFDDVPAGTWTLKAWHEEAATTASETIRVTAGPEGPVAIRLDVSGYKAEPHKNKYGRDYPPQAPSDDERY